MLLCGILAVASLIIGCCVLASLYLQKQYGWETIFNKYHLFIFLGVLFFIPTLCLIDCIIKGETK